MTSALLTSLTWVSAWEGPDSALSAARLTLSSLTNAGVAWAGISVLAGRIVRAPVQAGLAGVPSRG